MKFDFKILELNITEDSIYVDLNDGRTIIVPLIWYPRLFNASQEERESWRLIGDGDGVHWTYLDEDISINHFVLGRRSGESQRSLQQWLGNRVETYQNIPTNLPQEPLYKAQEPKQQSQPTNQPVQQEQKIEEQIVPQNQTPPLKRPQPNQFRRRLL